SACPFLGIARSGSYVLPLQRLWRLRRVWMLGGCADLELRDLLTGQPIPRKHSFDRLPQDLFRPPRELLTKRPAANPTGITRVAVVALLVELVAGDLDLLCVDDDHEIPRVDVPRCLRLALAADNVRVAGRQRAGSF